MITCKSLNSMYGVLFFSPQMVANSYEFGVKQLAQHIFLQQQQYISRVGTDMDVTRTWVLIHDVERQAKWESMAQERVCMYVCVFPSRPICATQTCLDKWPSTRAWLTYQGLYSQKKTVSPIPSSQQLPMALCPTHISKIGFWIIYF